MSLAMMTHQKPGAEYTLAEVGLTAGYLRRLEREGVIPRARRIGAGRIRIYTNSDVEEIRRRLCR